MKAMFGVVSLACLLASGQSLAQSARPAMEMHRTQAGTLDASGWTIAASTNGAFEVRLPCPFNDFTVNVDEPVVIKTFVVGCRLADGSKYSVSRIVYRESARAAQGKFDSAVKDGLWPGSTTVVGSHKGAPTVASSSMKDGGCGWGQLHRAGADALLMVVEAKGPTCQGLEAKAQQFFGSAEVRSL